MLTSILALAITAFLVEVARRLAPAVGLVDSPNERKAHEGDIPLVGGIAIFMGLLLVLALKGMLLEHWAFFVAAGLLVSTGIWDDIFGVSPHPRLLMQAIAVSVLAVVGGTYVSDLGTILPVLGTLELGLLAIPFTLFAGVGAINAFNMSDGVDGLCGTLTLIALIGLGIAAGLAGKESELILTTALAGGVIGFLIFNVRLPKRKQAMVFLGDAGSYLMGLSVLYLAIRLTQGADRAIAPVTALWFCMLPLLDTVGMILRRTRRGKSPFSPDREHIHHVFLLAKFSVTTTWMGLAAAATAGMVFGLIGHVSGIPESVMFALFMLTGVLYYGMIMRTWRVLRFLSRSINRRKMARLDRRSGADRRKRNVGYYVNGVLTERRSGTDRRNGNGDRRNEAEQVSPTLINLQQSNDSDSRTDRAARLST